MTETSQDLTDAIVRWWGDIRTNRGDRADLRRCRTPADVAMVPAYYRLTAAVPTLNREKLAVVAGVLAYVNTPMPGVPVAEQFARPKEGGTAPKVSDVRFRQLLRVEDGDYAALFPTMKRLVTMVNGTVNIPDLVWSLYNWTPQTKMRWAEAYYTNSPSNK